MHRLKARVIMIAKSAAVCIMLRASISKYNWMASIKDAGIRTAQTGSIFYYISSPDTN